jgi:molecular chaperone HscB
MSADVDKARPAVPVKCTACQQTLDTPLFCNSCRRLYPADGLNYFELLGLSPTYDIEPEQVREKYFEVVREIHPDRLAADGAHTQHLSMRVSAQLNQAFHVLLDPVQRAEYLLEMSGGKAAADDKQVPQQVLMDTLELREEIEEAKAAGDQAALHRMREQTQQRFDETLQGVSQLCRQLPGDDALRQRLRNELNAIRYFRKLLEQL